ncbi:ras-related protein Rab-28-like [Coccinella septempunctata]|uniref:ras-related protein Rab-28-like n=1 Tax=Coccinella septempunctata TaxID=41139 RepID=UPI001D094DE0|nr:ras-related protein Rab-28-like [Coccinella septempunctata]
MSDSDGEGIDVEKQVKIVILGETNVGKTSLIKRYCFDEFSRYYNQTVGADFYLRRLALPGRHEVTVRISDIGGFEFKGSMLPNYLFNTDIIILMYDITNSVSFEYLLVWLNEVDKIVKKRPLVAVVGSKCDVEHHRNVKPAEVKRFVENQNMLSFLVSSKTGEGVNNCFLELVAGHLGIPLTDKDKEQQQSIVKAEIMPPSARVPMKPQKTGSTSQNSSSSVCCMQ